MEIIQIPIDRHLPRPLLYLRRFSTPLPARKEQDDWGRGCHAVSGMRTWTFEP